MGDRKHDPSTIPHANDDVGQRNFLNPPKLILDNDDIVYPNRLGESNLESSDEISEGSLRCNPENDADDTCRC